MIWYIWRMLRWRNDITMKHFFTLNSSYNITKHQPTHPIFSVFNFQVNSNSLNSKFFLVNQWYHLVIISVFYKNWKWSCSVLNLCIIQSCTTTITVCRGQLLLEKNPGVLNIRKRHSCCLFILFSIFWEESLLSLDMYLSSPLYLY